MIYATAGDDQGSYDPQSVVDLVRHAAGPGQPFTISGAAGPRSGFCNVGGLFAGPSPRLAALADAAGGLHREICDPAWIDAVVAGGLPVAGQRRRFMLDEAADPGSVMVWLDGVLVPAVDSGSGAEQWSLRTGAVELVTPPARTAVLEVAYRPLCD
ncbi:MAG: hypothetical protein H6730_25445 [Deltaproteobacteria bacterium]|nr:hypothetical protein [Deltaproteobacteria bacterium]